MSLIKRISSGEPRPKPTNESWEIRKRVTARLLDEVDPALDTLTIDGYVAIRRQLDAILAEEQIELGAGEKKAIADNVLTVMSSGPLRPLMADSEIVEIMVNSPQDVLVEHRMTLRRSDVVFEGVEQLLAAVNRLFALIGLQLDDAHPIANGRLPDGSIINAVLDPISVYGPTITIRKFSKVPLTVQNIIYYGSVTVPMMEFLRATVIAGTNIVVSGGQQHGKTTLLNILTGFIPADERVVTIEHRPELQLRQEHVISLLTRWPDSQGQGEVTMRDLVRNAGHMRADRIVVGECREGETLDWLQLMSFGHDGGLTTVFAANPRDALARLELMAMMSGIDWPARALRELIASTINLVVHIERLGDGSRKIMTVSEVQGLKGSAIALTDIFRFEQTGVENDRIQGSLQPTGVRPKILRKIEDSGIQLPPQVFGPEPDTPDKA